MPESPPMTFAVGDRVVVKDGLYVYVNGHYGHVVATAPFIEVRLEGRTNGLALDSNVEICNPWPLLESELEHVD